MFNFALRFGMVTMDTEVEELLTLVINTGREIDEAVAQLQTMSEVVKRGVLQAQDELKRESDNQIWQEGILRLVLDSVTEPLHQQSFYSLNFSHL